LSFLGLVAFCALVVSAINPTPTKRTNVNGPLPSGKFVTADNGEFSFNGNKLKFVGTNAYWLSVLNSDADIDATLANIASQGISVVRTWAFNDVKTVPHNGTWFQLIDNGATTINNGPNGLQRLDTVVKLAEKHGIFLQLALTNNWNPEPLVDKTTTGLGVIGRDVTQGTNNSLPRNTLSNDYGGMDVYVRAFSNSDVHKHDVFYTDQTILNAFLNYTTQIVTRYVNSPAVLGWEIANDPRCNSTLPATSTCNTNTITLWHSKVAQHIKSVDPNHLVTSGNHGFFCVDCPKLFPRAPPPQTSASPARRRRAPKPLTKKSLLEERRAALKRTAKADKRSLTGPSIRGRWIAPPTKRQSDEEGVGSSFDGTPGVDSEDILNIPEIGFGTFQLFPDQNTYGPNNPNLLPFNNTVQTGLAWIKSHAALSQLSNKPVTLTAFGLVTQENAPHYYPFNSTQPPFGSDSPSTSTTVRRQTTQSFGVTDPQRDDAYAQWLQAGLTEGLGAMYQYQWSQTGLTGITGSAVQPTVSGTSVSPVVTGTGTTPNDGYGIQGQGQAGAQSVLSEASNAFGSDAT
jgi:mannan endo-1,4-beta-mannosidase